MDDPQKSADANKKAQQAYEALKRGERVQAWDLAVMATRLDPDSERPWLLLAVMATPRRSVSCLNRALRLNPNSVMAKEGMAWALDRLRKEQEVQTKPVPVNISTPIMATSVDSQLETFESPRNRQTGTVARVAKYTLLRGIGLFASVCISIFLIVFIANLGGYMDRIQKALINEEINGMLVGGWLKEIPFDQRKPIIEETRAAMEASYGLNRPFLERSWNWFLRGISFDWGKARVPYVYSHESYNGGIFKQLETDDIRTLILAYLPRTLLLFGLSYIGLFIFSIAVALPMALKPRKWINRLIIWLAPTSSLPSWLVGVLMLSFVYYVLHDFSFQLGYNNWTNTFDLQSVPDILRSMLLPFLAIVVSKFFQSIYTMRNYFMIYSKQDYVDLAIAKGLPDNLLQRRYILRPTLPAIITNFVIILISIWQECIAVEYFFNIGGIGSYFMQALRGNDVMSIVALVSTFAYFLAFSVFILDIVYALIDPRVRIDETRQIERKSRGSLFSFGFLTNINKKQLSTKLELSSGLEKTHLTSQIKPSRKIKTKPFNHAWENLKLFVLHWKQELKEYPSITIGVWIITALVVIAVVTVTVMPYNKAISLWRGDDKAWIRNPREAPPAWTNFFRINKLPETIDLNSTDPSIQKIESTDANGNKHIIITLSFDYPYTSLPQDVLMMFSTNLIGSKPFVSMTWITPNGKEIPIDHLGVSDSTIYYVTINKKLSTKYNQEPPLNILFTEAGKVQKGQYQMKLDCTLFDQQTDINAEMIVFGQVYGLAGTDSSKRDLTLILLWGLAVALSFGILAAVGTTLISVTLAAVSAWFRGWIDGLIQRITEVNMVIPMLPVAIMIFYMYSNSFWVILGVIVVLSIFGNQIKNYRAMFLQVIEQPYIEAAVSYGVSDWRIIWQYMIPRIRNVIIPQLMILIPGYVFLETTLTFLGVSDPRLPTLGKLLYTIFSTGIFRTPLFMTLEMIVVFMMISIGFIFIGYGLEESYNDKTGI
jgi:peptide/nickel transport system permease protein